MNADRYHRARPNSDPDFGGAVPKGFPHGPERGRLGMGTSPDDPAGSAYRARPIADGPSRMGPVDRTLQRAGGLEGPVRPPGRAGGSGPAGRPSSPGGRPAVSGPRSRVPIFPADHWPRLGTAISYQPDAPARVRTGQPSLARRAGIGPGAGRDGPTLAGASGWYRTGCGARRADPRWRVGLVSDRVRGETGRPSLARRAGIGPGTARMRVGGPEPYLFHPEFLSGRAPGYPEHVHWYNALASHRHGLPVLSAVVLLRPAADGPELTGEYQQAVPGDATIESAAAGRADEPPTGSLGADRRRLAEDNERLRREIEALRGA